MLAVAAVVHLGSLWLLPRLIMQRAMAKVAGDRPPAAVLAPPTDHRQRRIVMPSPDLAYAVCVWDVSRQPLRVRADPKLGDRYWSIALYAANSDNFFVLNDRQAQGMPVQLILLGPDQEIDLVPPQQAVIVRAPSRQGLLLMRVLIGEPQRDQQAADAARRSLSCEYLPAPTRP
jgi:uncharacterized membrane protein